MGGGSGGGDGSVELPLDLAPEGAAERPGHQPERRPHADRGRAGLQAAVDAAALNVEGVAVPAGRHAELAVEPVRHIFGRPAGTEGAEAVGADDVDVGHSEAGGGGLYAVRGAGFVPGFDMGASRGALPLAPPRRQRDLVGQTPPFVAMIEPFLNLAPRLGTDVFVAPTAAVVGDVTLGDGASVWYGASLRGDVHWIEIGRGSNIQDNATVHVSRGTHPCEIQERVTVGHNAVVHGCTVEDDCLIGMGAVVLDGAVIGAGSTVGAGTLVTMNTVVPPRSLVLGAPGRVVRTLTDEEVERNRANAFHYVRMSRMYLGLDTPRSDGGGADSGPEGGPMINPFYVDDRPPRKSS